MLELMTRILACLVVAAAIGFVMAWLLRGLSARNRFAALQADFARQQARTAAASNGGAQAESLRAQVALLESQLQRLKATVDESERARHAADVDAEAAREMAASTTAKAQRDAEAHRRLLAERDAAVEEARNRHAASERAARDAEVRLVDAGQIADTQRVAAHAASEAARQANQALEAERALRARAAEDAMAARRAEAGAHDSSQAQLALVEDTRMKLDASLLELHRLAHERDALSHERHALTVALAQAREEADGLRPLQEEVVALRIDAKNAAARSVVLLQDQAEAGGPTALSEQLAGTDTAMALRESRSDEEQAAALAMSTLRERLTFAENAAERGEGLTRELEATRAELSGVRQHVLQAEARARQAEALGRQAVEQRDLELARLNAELQQRSRDVEALAERINGEQAVLAQREQAVAAQPKETAIRAEAAQAEAIALRLRRDQQDARLALMAAFEAQAARYKAAVAERDASLDEMRQAQQAASQDGLLLREELSSARKAVAETRAAHAAAEVQAAETLRRYETQMAALQQDLERATATVQLAQTDAQAHARAAAEQEIASLSAQLELADRLARGAEQAQARVQELETELAQLKARAAMQAQSDAHRGALGRASDEASNEDSNETVSEPSTEALPHNAPWQSGRSGPLPVPKRRRPPSATAASDGNEHDDLKRIYGIGPVLERLLNSLGIIRFSQIAAWTQADIARVDSQLVNFHGRIERDHWVAGARMEHLRKYGEEL